jgi:3',5'-cyclic AMP phosphodiesterase CpdA
MILAQISDLHVMRAGKRAYGVFDTSAYLARAVDRLNALSPRPDVVLITGDLVDTGSAEEYSRLAVELARLEIPFRLIPGNHDARATLRAAFPAQPWEGAGDSFCHYVDETWPVRIVALDSLTPGEVAGSLCETRLGWLDRVLSRDPARPTMVMIHHPPFETGIDHMDRLPLRGVEGFAEVLARHGCVLRVVSGHAHRAMSATLGGRVCTTCPSTAHHFALDLEPGMPARWTPEPPGFQVHRHMGGMRLVTHSATIEPFPATPAKAG